MGSCINGGTHKISNRSIVVGGRNLRLIHPIGSGGFAQVYKAQDVNTQQYYALKKINCENQEYHKLFKLELQAYDTYVQQKLGRHEHIVEVIASELPSQQPKTGYLLMTLAKQNLVKSIQQNPNAFPESRSLAILYQVALAVQHMHKYNVIHRDIKPENILETFNGSFQLCDFGSSTFQEVKPSNISKARMNQLAEEYDQCTTLAYRPPQMIDLYRGFEVGKKSDMWMVGCLAYLLAYKQHPFKESSKLQILSGNLKYEEGIVSSEYKKLIEGLLKPNPRQRQSASGLVCELQKLVNNINPQQIQVRI